MAVSLLKYANREAVAKALTANGYAVSRATVNRWARGNEMPEVAARMIAELFAHTEEAAEPEWVQRLRDDLVGEIQLNREAIASALGADLSALRERMDDALGRIEQTRQRPAADPAGRGRSRRVASGDPRPERR